MATLRTLLVSLQAKTDGFSRDMQRARGEITQLRQSVQQSQSGVQAFGASLPAVPRRRPSRW